MLELNGRHFYQTTRLIQHTLTSLQAKDDFKGPMSDGAFRALMVERCNELEKSLVVLGAKITQMAVLELQHHLNGFYPTYEGLIAGFDDITKTLKREMSNVKLLALEPTEAALYAVTEPYFGEDVFNKFPAAREDIEESAKCLALSRNTAAVFHLMRALECSVQVIAARIGATIADQSGKGLPWGVIAENMKPKIDGMAKGSDKQIKWYRVQSDLVVVNRAWRVPTNHPKESYTAEQAREVFDATKTFMRELSELV